MKKVIGLLVSTRITLVLLLSFAASMAVATFIEKNHSTEVARSAVYNTVWFELLMAWMAVNLLMHIRQYNLLSKTKWPVAIFHLAFVVIIIGAGITRYVGYEGTVRVRVAGTSNELITEKFYLQCFQEKDSDIQQIWQKQKRFAANSFNQDDYKVGGADLKLVDFIPAAKEDLVAGKTTLLKIVTVGNNGRQDNWLAPNGILRVGKINLSYGNDTSADIQIKHRNNGWFIYAKLSLQYMVMATQQSGKDTAYQEYPLHTRALYRFDGGQFVVEGIYDNSAIGYKTETNKEKAQALGDLLIVRLSKGKYSKQINLLARPSIKPDGVEVKLGTETYWLCYGPKILELPFYIELKKFELERYPGSNSPSSYASKVIVHDGEKALPYKIYMNHVLDYRGYRFFQSSYDSDEKGTILSVNHDWLGTWVTYLGYALLAFAMITVFFFRFTRFRQLSDMLAKVISKKNTLIGVLFFFLSFSSFSAESNQFKTLKELHVSDELATQYGSLIVQDFDGRMKPLNTMALELTRKIVGKPEFVYADGLQQLKFSANQFLLATQMYPVAWRSVPIIKIDAEKGLQIFSALKVKPASKLSLIDFINTDGSYKLKELVESANLKSPSRRNEADNEVLKVDERFNIYFNLLIGDYLKIFPKQEDASQTWYTANQSENFKSEAALFVKNISGILYGALYEDNKSGNYKNSKTYLDYIATYQKLAGKAVYPSSNHIQAEIFYNNHNPLTILFPSFWLLGLILLVVVLLRIFYVSPWLKILRIILVALSYVGLLLYTCSLLLRWYIAEHPPWTDGFEMLIFVAWGLLLVGLLFSKRSEFTAPLSLLFSGTLLFVAYLDWLNPEITNLVPVLKSYWLKIHVAVIVSSYAPLALSALLGLTTLLLIVFRPSKPSERWRLSLKELTLVSEMSITIGLFMISIGTFLGGVWASESWGRYWSWDPKETWALISIIVYAIVLHTRLVPALKGILSFSIFSLWAFSSIVMTSFGVNYYLAGMHSYAKGDPVPVPTWVYWTTFLFIFITLLAIVRWRKWPRDIEKPV